jgi:hypothetical protein
MRVDKAHTESNVDYSKVTIVPAPPNERDPGKGAIVSKERFSLPAPYKRREIKKTEAYIVNLSSPDVRTSERDSPVMQAVFDLDRDKENEIGRLFGSWERTVAGIVGREVKKGIYVNKVV